MAFDPKRRRNLRDPLTGILSAERLVDELRRLPADTPISICGATDAFIHVDVDDHDNVIGATLDHDPLDDAYPEGTFDDDDDPVNYCYSCMNYNNDCIPEHDPCNECDGTKENHKWYKSRVSRRLTRSKNF